MDNDQQPNSGQNFAWACITLGAMLPSNPIAGAVVAPLLLPLAAVVLPVAWLRDRLGG